MILRNLVHCVLALVVAFAGLARSPAWRSIRWFYPNPTDVGAVAIIIVFATLLTRSHEPRARTVVSPGWVTSSLSAAAVFGILAWSIRSSVISSLPIQPRPEVTVKQIGDALMSQFVLPLEVIGLLLTAALVGAVTIAMREQRSRK